MVRIHTESYGSGASSVKTYVHDDLVLSVLDVELLPAEAVVIASGRKDLVLEMRSSFQLELETSFTAAVERATGRKVIAFLSDTHLDPPFVTELFRLGPSHEQEQQQELGDLEVEETVQRVLESSPDAPSEARHALDALADRLEPELLDDLRLLVTELVTNAVRHAEARQGAPIDLEVSLSDRKVRVEVSDSGSAFNSGPLTDPSPGAGGSGLFLVGKLASRWGVITDPTTRVWLEIDLPRA
jgi:anti-sigma regulatory factor (Ser/Thr protein kinase)/uncharacterized protein YbcI